MPLSSELVLHEPLTSRSCRLRHPSTIMRPSPMERQARFPTLVYKLWLLPHQCRTGLTSMQEPVVFRWRVVLHRLCRLPRRWKGQAQATLLKEDADEVIRLSAVVRRLCLLLQPCRTEGSTAEA